MSLVSIIILYILYQFCFNTFVTQNILIQRVINHIG